MKTYDRIKKMSRSELIAILELTDPNGCYSDEDCKLENFPICTKPVLLNLCIDAEISDDYLNIK